MTDPCPKEIHVSAYVDEELGSADTASMDAHLLVCKGCRQLLKSYQGVDQMIHGLPEIKTTASFERNLNARINTITADPAWMSYLKYMLTGMRPVYAATVAVILVIGVMFYSTQDQKALSPDELVIVENLEFFTNFEILEKLELLENWDHLSVANDLS